MATRREVAETVSNALAAARKQKSIANEISIAALDRTKADIAKWRTAIEEWEDERQPDRYEMAQLYQEIEMDDSVSTHVNAIKMAIEGTEYEIGTVNGEDFTQDIELTKRINKGFLQAVINQAIDAEMQGFSLVEVMPSENHRANDLNLMPRHLVIPEKGLLRIRPQTEIGAINYTDPKYTARLLQFGDKKDKGLFNKLAVLYIYKKNALALWANYQSKFGIPPVIVKTDLSNKQKVESLSAFLGEMRSNSFALVGFDDTVDVLQGVNTDAYNTFLNLITHADKQIAKVLEGQTMTSNDGSSRSQAEVHERIADEWHVARLRRIERAINEQLLPILIADGYQLEGQIFRFKEIKDVDAIIDRVVKLKEAGFTVPADYLGQITGLPLEDAPEPEPIKAPGFNKDEQRKAAAMLAQIDELYYRSAHASE